MLQVIKLEWPRLTVWPWWFGGVTLLGMAVGIVGDFMRNDALSLKGDIWMMVGFTLQISNYGWNDWVLRYWKRKHKAINDRMVERLLELLPANATEEEREFIEGVVVKYKQLNQG